jgi:hypothetical protein
MLNRRNFIGSTAVLGVAAATSVIAASPAAAGGTTTHKGSFEGRSNHVTSGSVKIVEKGGRTFVVLGRDFSLDGGPDPRVALGKDGKYDPDTKLGALLDLKGKQRYALPATVDVSKYNEVYIWCDVAGVPLGVASLK